MAKEKSWASVTLPIVSVNGAKVELPSTVGLFTKQKIILSAIGQPTKEFQITSVLDSQNVHVSDAGKSLGATADVSAYTDGVLFAPAQPRNTIGNAPITRNSYAEEPISALRTVEVGPTGEPMTTPKGQIGAVDPDTKFSYGSAFEVLRIEESEQSSAKRYTSTITTNVAGSFIELSGVYHQWMRDASGLKQFALFETDVIAGEATSVVEYTITGFNQYKSTDYVSPNSARAINFDNATSQISITGISGGLPEWVLPGLRFKVIGGLNDTTAATPDFLTVNALIDANTFTTVEVIATEAISASTLDARVSILDVMPAPLLGVTFDPLVNPAIIDGSLGDKSKATVFEYGSAFEVTDIYTESDTKTVDDLIQGLRKKPL